MDAMLDGAENAGYLDSLNELKPTCPFEFGDKPALLDFHGSHPDQFTYEAIMATSSGFYLFGRFCRELGPDVYNKHIFLEEHVKLLKCNSVRNAKDVGGNMMDSFLDDNALGPSPVDATDVSLRINLGPVDAAHVGEIGGATNPIAFNLSHSLFEECEEALRLCKKAGTLDLTPFNCIAKAVFAWLHGNHFDKFKASAYYKKYLKFQHFFANHTFSEMDFEVFRVLGRGGFGLVNGCRCIRTGRMYAMKTMDKRRVKMNKGEEMCCFEKELLACCNSRFVLDLKYSFVNNYELFIIMDVKAGGDLNFHINEKKKFTAEMTKYYMARVCEGIQDMHDAGWIYRDLKPENLLVDLDGTMMISDLGLACKCAGAVEGIAGTPGYWPPEMLRKEPYDRMVDFWTLGVVFVEFLTGKCPFRNKAALAFGKSKGEKDKLLSCNLAVLDMEVEYDPALMSEQAIDLAKKLLTKQPRDRLGAGGIADIKAHEYFAGYDWDSVKDGSMDPPFVPESDAANAADQDTIGKFKNENEIKSIDLSDKDHARYKTFSQSNKHAFEEDCTGFMMWEKNQGRPLTASAEIEKSKTCVIS